MFNVTVCLTLTNLISRHEQEACTHVLKCSAEPYCALCEMKAVGFFKPLDSPIS